MKKKFVFVCLCCMCVMFVNAQELERGVQSAVNQLTRRLMTRMDVSIGSLTLRGTDAPSPFTDLLYEFVRRYADNAPLFRVVGLTRDQRRHDDPLKGIINGTFSQRGDRVEVFLYLVSDLDGESLGSAELFTFPMTELTERGITLAPENAGRVQEREEIFSQLAGTGGASGQSANAPNTNAPQTNAGLVNQENQNIHIQAFFNSDSMTYRHRDELKMTVSADRDCYFKVIHIDVNNQMRMIYPNSTDRDNFLSANTSMKILENMTWRLYEPYGAETILVIASSRRFENIDREYNAPWRPMTAEALRAEVMGKRGGDFDPRAPITFSGQGEVRYTITILKPDEEYSYRRPENMTEFFQNLRNDTLRQGGTFSPDNNDRSGSYIINGVRGSYRIPSDSPDIIQFAMYNLDNYRSGLNLGARTRGTGFNFSFARPVNIAQAVRTVRTEIEGSGGTFTGNEQQGNFRAKGITGQYRVTDVVNITITEKPFIVPNSVIEREVRSYFGRE